MEVLETAQITGYIGEEFLMWLWFKTNCLDSLLPVPGHGDVEVIFDNYIRLDAYLTDDERSEFRGGNPAYSVEAKTALQQGKRISKAKIRVFKEGREWQFSITGKTLDMSGIKIPAVLSREDDEKFYERIYLLEELEEIIETLYLEFIKIRVNAAWNDICLPAMRAWISNPNPPVPSDYPSELHEFNKGEFKTTFQTPSAGHRSRK